MQRVFTIITTGVLGTTTDTIQIYRLTQIAQEIAPSMAEFGKDPTSI
jgi:hypothetical protein